MKNAVFHFVSVLFLQIPEKIEEKIRSSGKWFMKIGFSSENGLFISSGEIELKWK